MPFFLQTRRCRGTSGNFSADFPTATWFRGVFWSKRGDFADHDPVTDDVFSAWNGSFVALWREPARRAVSWFTSKYLRNENTPQRNPRFVNGTMTLVQAARHLEGNVALLLGQRAARVSRKHAKADALAVAMHRFESALCSAFNPLHHPLDPSLPTAA